MYVLKCFIVFVLSNLITISDGARILAYVPTPSISHQVVFQPLWRELSLRGHQVTLITTDPINDPALTNLTEIDLHFSYDIIDKGIRKIVTVGDNVFGSLIDLINIFNEIVDKQMEHQSIQKLIHDRTEKFDVVLIEQLLAPPIALAKRFDCPLVGLSSLQAFEFMNNLMGVPTHPVLYPDVLLPFDKTETFVERLISVGYQILIVIISITQVNIKNELIEKHFGKGFGTVNELITNVSLFLVNSNPIFDRPRPMVPAVIQIGGIHKKPPKSLPLSLKNTLNSAGEGFIYFSLGSNVKSKDISMETRQVFLDTFSELPYKVLWKFELDDLPDKPDNVIISKWFPQTDVLRHHNIKLFITQGGLQSIEEAIYGGIPMIGIPYIADQPANVQKMVRRGFGLYINPATIEKKYFKEAIMEVINNPRYRKKVKEISQLAQDQPIPPLEEAVWWIEYVIRHKGATHLRSPLLDIPWYQFLLLDVIACLALIVVIFVCALYFLIQIILKFFRFLLKSKTKQKSS